uniref:Uncharacterized protein LOC105120428 isoform X1 n=1 Tax=Rhizophora mucronata TaxID=61149 RepID=A0A2P2KCN7_RHIMU
MQEEHDSQDLMKAQREIEGNHTIRLAFHDQSYVITIISLHMSFHCTCHPKPTCFHAANLCPHTPSTDWFTYPEKKKLLLYHFHFCNNTLHTSFLMLKI